MKFDFDVTKEQEVLGEKTSNGLIPNEHKIRTGIEAKLRYFSIMLGDKIEEN